MGNNYQLGISIGGMLSPSLTNAVNSAKGIFKSLGPEISSLNQKKIDIKQFKALQKNAGDSKEKLDILRESFKKSKIDVNNLDGELRRFNVSLLNIKKQSKIRLQIDKGKQELNAFKGNILAAGASMFALKKFVDARSDVLQAQGEIATLGMTEGGIKKVTDAAKGFSSQWAGTTTSDFIRASYDIKSGISTLGDTAVGEFTRIAALTGAATKSSTGEMTNLFAKGYGIYRDQFEEFGKANIAGWNKMSDEEKDIQFGKHFSAGISQSVQSFRTDGSQMSQALSTLGSAASAAGVSIGEQFAVLGKLQATFSGSESATKYKAFMNSAVKAGEKLGLQFVGQNGKLKSMADMLTLIKQKYDGNIDAMEEKQLADAFGSSEASDLIKMLGKDIDGLKTAQNSLNGSMKGGISLTEKMAKAAQRGKEFQLLGQRIQNLGAVIGEGLYPAAGLLAGAIGGLTMGVTALHERFPILTNTIFTAGTAFIGIIAVMKTARMASMFFKLEILQLKNAYLGLMARYPQLALSIRSMGNLFSFAGIKAGFLNIKTKALMATQAIFGTASAIFTSGIGMITGAFSTLNLTLMASPIGLVVGGIVAAGAVIGGVGYLIYKYWEPLSGLFSGIWASITESASAFFSWIFDKLSFLGDIFKGLGGFFGISWGEEGKPTETKSASPIGEDLPDNVYKIPEQTKQDFIPITKNNSLKFRPVS